MHILLSNDDGYNAAGLATLANTLADQHHSVTIVAPRENMSGCGMGMSLRKRISVEQLSEHCFIVDGTPVDCVYLGLKNLVNKPVDMVVSGINNGANLADDVFYSGTFAAAMEARRLRLPAIALSMTEYKTQHYETAAHVVVKMINSIHQLEYRSLLAVLNINVPEIPFSGLRDLKATVLGVRSEPLVPVEEMSSDNRRYFRLAPAGDFERRKRAVMQDFEAIEQGMVSVTPLSAQFDDQAYIEDVQRWLDRL